MLKKSLLVLLLSVSGLIAHGYSQSFFFGIKGGPSWGFQKWENFNQKPVFTYHIAGFIESYSEDNPLNVLYAQLGYHNRGSAWRGARGITYNNVVYVIPTKNFLFRNLSLGLGAKRKQQLNEKVKSFYSFGIRLEYTLNTNLHQYDKINESFFYYFPTDAFVKKFTYGAVVGGGVEFAFSELVEGLIELTVNPDLSNQYDQPQLSSVVNPWNHNTTTLRRRRIKNTTIELTFGLRFMRKVEYVD